LDAYSHGYDLNVLLGLQNREQTGVLSFERLLFLLIILTLFLSIPSGALDRLDRNLEQKHYLLLIYLSTLFFSPLDYTYKKRRRRCALYNLLILERV